MRFFNKNTQQSFTCSHMFPKQTKCMLFVGLNYEAVSPSGMSMLHMYSQERNPVSLLCASFSETFSEQKFHINM